MSEFRDLWWSKADFSDPIRITNANPQQSEYKWGTAKLVEWTNYENKPNKGILYLPEDYDPQKEYPVLVQFYETHSGGLNTYHAPMLSSAMCDVFRQQRIYRIHAGCAFHYRNTGTELL